MLRTYEDAMRMKQKIKHFGIDAGDTEEIRLLLNQLITLSEVFLQYDKITFERDEFGWDVMFAGRISSDSMMHLYQILGDG
jgi:hypothetical protein